MSAGFFDSVGFPCSVILSDEGGDRYAEGLIDQPPDNIDPAIGGPGRDGIDAKSIDGSLKNHIGNREHGGSDGGWKADAKDPDHDAIVKADVAEFKLHARRLLSKDKGYGAGGEGLGDHGCDCSTENAHGEDGNKKKIQNNVDKACQDQNIERPPGVSDGSKNAGSHVIDQGEDQAGHKDSNVCGGVSHQSLWGLQKMEKRV